MREHIEQSAQDSEMEDQRDETEKVYLGDILDLREFRKAQGDGLIAYGRYSGDGQLIYNYTPKAQHTPGAFDNSAVRICRGLIVDATTLEVVARPLPKFFNYGQSEADRFDLDEWVIASDKVDGSLGIIHIAPDGLPRIATRGSFFSAQAVHATKVLRERFPDWRPTPGLTSLVEIVYPENRIVVDYGDTDDLIYLGEVTNSSGRFTPYEHCCEDCDSDFHSWPGNFAKPVKGLVRLREVLEVPSRENAEGLVITSLKGDRMLKIKQEDYVALHKTVTGLNERSVWQWVMEGKSLPDILGPLPDELHDWTTQVRRDLMIRATNMALDASETLDDVLRAPQVRRAIAAEVVGRSNAALVFAELDGKDVYKTALKSLKPKGDG